MSTSEAAVEPNAEPDPCDCYKKHFAATSCAGCDCSCVLIATVSTRFDTKDVALDMNRPDDIETKVDPRVRR